MAIVSITPIKLPQRLPRIVITTNPMKVINEYKNSVNSFPQEVYSLKSKEGKSLEAMLNDVLNLQRTQKSDSPCYHTCDETVSAILTRLPKLIGGKYLQ
jgi:hypothetical protein